METVLVLADQLRLDHGALADRSPGDCRILIVEAQDKIAGRSWHRQRLHLFVAGLRKFARDASAAGFEVDHRVDRSFRSALSAHRAEFSPDRIVAMTPMNRTGRDVLDRAGVELVPNTQFSCSSDDFAAWARGRRSLKMEDFYRWRRVSLDLLMEGDDPAGGKWNHDHDNRKPPPRDGRAWPAVTRFERDDIDHAVLAEMADRTDLTGDEPAGWWPTTRAEALQRLDEFIADALVPFGPFEDAMLSSEWKLAHSTLSTALNMGFLDPLEVAEAAIAAFERGDAPVNSVEGFVRQVIGWREYVYGLYWLWGDAGYAEQNALGADRPVPPAFLGEPTQMRCVSTVIERLGRYGWNHHIERLMIIGNLALTAGIDPQAVTAWMWETYVDGADWVMVPNVVGMALHADGGRMATKPYASGGAYISKMSDFCKGCHYDPKQRVGERACPYTTLYWDFLARHEERFARNHRMARQVAAMRRLADLDQVRERAVEVRSRLDAGTL